MSEATSPPERVSPFELSVAPSPEHWEDWVELDAGAWPKRVEKHYRLIPTICFNCESACGLLAYVDRETGAIRRFEGNPVHPGSRGRTCAKGPATLNQVNDPERILTPMKRVGPRGGGRFEPVSWDEVLADVGGRIRKALQEERRDEVMYHVGRPGEDHFMQRLFTAWGVDGVNSHTNVCSASARTGFALWCGADRPSPDYSQAKFALLLSAHLETGHYFNPHAQRIQEARQRGMRLAVVDTRLSNTSTHADHWVSTWPGSEAALLLGIAHKLLVTRRIDAAFVERWTNWTAWLEANDPDGPRTFERFLDRLTATYAEYTPERVADECRVDAGIVETLADEIAAAGSHFTSHLWRNTASGNLGGWQVARSLMLLHVLTGSFGTPGGLNPNSWDKLVPTPSDMPPAIEHWNETLWPKAWPLAHYEMSFLLPHLLEEQGRRLEVYVTRVYNPVWTNPDGCSWIEMLEDENRVGCHVALTPIWSETAQWADYVLPVGLGPERHDVMSQETHAGTWIGFRQPVLREHLRREGKDVADSREANPGQVWEEAEWWIALTWAIDPDGSLGIRRWYESKDKPGTPISVTEYFNDLLGNVPGLKDAAAKEGKDPIGYMRRYGAYEAPYAGQQRYEKPGPSRATSPDADTHGCTGFGTPSGRLEVWSDTLATWGHPDQAMPGYIRSQVHWSNLDEGAGEMALLPTFRLPTLIHTRSSNAKWLQEISHTNPLWLHPTDAKRIGVVTGDLARVATRIGWFVGRVWVTEGIHPGVVACSHHVGRWRLFQDVGGHKQASSQVDLTREGTRFRFRQKHGAEAFASKDPDSERTWWREVGVNQNLTFPVQPDPVSGMHCWHQRVTVIKAESGDQYGDVVVDTAKSREVYAEWKQMAKPAPGPGGLRRPLWLKRPMHPVEALYHLGEEA
ncbi:MAG: molybdopterin-dependent oxidoreductase [Planctomycetes bacterium]|nr:molybdopterin-dependent oxidoreductase [Planctomycetota bacterium]